MRKIETPRPDYENSIVNLMASIGRRYGIADTGYAPLAQLPASRLSGRTIVLIVVDGLGAEYLGRYPDSFLHRNQVGRLTSVFPTTTASAITAFATGVGPRQHGIPGWFTWLRELGSVAAVLPFRPRSGGPSYGESGISAEAVVGGSPFASRLDAPSYSVGPDYLIDSDFNRCCAGTAKRIGYASMDDFFGRLITVIRTPGEKYVYAYWPELDALAHAHGVASDAVRESFLSFDAALEQFAGKVRGQGATILVTADHGLIDTSPERTIHLAHHPEFADTLLLPLCGEPRAAYCYVRGGQGRRFRDYVESHFRHCCWLLSSVELLQQDYLGLGRAHPELAARIGDYTLLMKDNWIIKDQILGERPFAPLGVHGGLSREELYVPLVVLEP